MVVTDNGSPPLSGSKTFTVNVVPFNHPPVLSTIPTQNVDEGNLLTIDLTATDSDVPAQSINYTLARAHQYCSARYFLAVRAP